MKLMMRARTFMKVMIEFKETYDLKGTKKMKAERNSGDKADDESQNPHGDHDEVKGDERSGGNEEDESKKG